MTTISTSRGATARLKPLQGDRYKILCDAKDIEDRPCNGHLGTLIRERDLLDEFATQGTSEERKALLSVHAKMDMDAWSQEHIDTHGGVPVRLGVPSWRILPPPSDRHNPGGDAGFRKVAEAEGVYEPLKSLRRRNSRARRSAPSYLATPKKTVRGHYPEPPVHIICPSCGRRVQVSLDTLQQAVE